jgi:energy-coupling factor transporter ATP-binding protein EcfA2
MANIGDPEVIFLDEPTTGLDPKNRLQLWKIIEAMKKDRLVVLTTHSMEEADALADKIAIMALGNLRAVGNSMHLKNRFGAGYHIEIIATLGKSDEAKARIATIMPDAVLNVESSGNLSYTLPTTRLDMLQKCFVFLETESDKARHGQPGLIQDWGISQTTLEEVFMRLTHGDAHTFAGQRDGGGGEKQKNLNVAFVDSPDKYLGFILVETITTLREVRFAMDSIDSLRFNFDFEFMMNGVPVARAQEESLFATDFLPAILIRKKLDAPPSAPTNLLMDEEEANDYKRDEVKKLRKQLEMVQSEKVQLANEVEDLKKRIRFLEDQLAKATASTPLKTKDS